MADKNWEPVFPPHTGSCSLNAGIAENCWYLHQTTCKDVDRYLGAVDGCAANEKQMHELGSHHVVAQEFGGVRVKSNNVGEHQLGHDVLELSSSLSCSVSVWQSQNLLIILLNVIYLQEQTHVVLSKQLFTKCVCDSSPLKRFVLLLFLDQTFSF